MKRYLTTCYFGSCLRYSNSAHIWQVRVLKNEYGQITQITAYDTYMYNVICIKNVVYLLFMY